MSDYTMQFGRWIMIFDRVPNFSAVFRFTIEAQVGFRI
jgi:hypothetical protein